MAVKEADNWGDYQKQVIPVSIVGSVYKKLRSNYKLLTAQGKQTWLQ